MFCFVYSASKKPVVSVICEDNSKIKLGFEEYYYHVSESNFLTKTNLEGSTAKTIFDRCANQIWTPLHTDERDRWDLLEPSSRTSKDL